MVSRRNVLLGSAVGVGALPLTRPAHAFSVEEVPPKSGLAFALSDRCAVDAEHERIAADLRASLAARGAAPGTQLTVSCPLCGCPITVAEK
ncbi:MAG: hypothetical protein U1E45_19385 [Geminicoccaceae bacterium]